jgi:hypothetical protein
MATAVSEKVMAYAPGQVSTEPLLETQGSSFSSPPLEIAPRADPHYPGLATRYVAPPRLTQPPFAEAPQATQSADLTVLQLPPSPAPKTAPVVQDWAAQIEQLRNDIFGIAMNVSALNDRLDRMEQRLPQSGQSPQAGIATLRNEIEIWLESHLNGAVEHCMHRIIHRTNAPATQPVN